MTLEILFYDYSVGKKIIKLTLVTLGVNNEWPERIIEERGGKKNKNLGIRVEN